MVIQSYTVRVHKVLVIQHCKPKLSSIPGVKMIPLPRIRPPRPSPAHQAPQKLGIVIFRPLLHHS